MDNAIINTCPSILLISYDNDLRGDDAAGLRVSDAIARICSEGFPPENPLPELSSGQDAFSILGHRAGEAIAHRLNDNTAQNLTFLINTQARQHKLSCIYAIAAAIWRQESAQRRQDAAQRLQWSLLCFSHSLAQCSQAVAQTLHI